MFHAKYRQRLTGCATGRHSAANRHGTDAMTRHDPDRALVAQPTCRQRPASTTTAPNSSALEISHAYRLRRKLAAASSESLVQTVWGIGYRLMDRP